MPEIIEIPTSEIKFLIRRDRDRREFEMLKSAIREIGIRQPLQVRDITSWPAKDRRRPDGGLYKWEALFGEGRVTVAIELFKETNDPRWKTVPGIVLDVPQGEVLARFLSENLMREDLSWVERAELLRSDINAGLTPQQLAEAHHLTAGHVEKLLRVLKRTSPKVLEAVRKMTVQEAEPLSRQSHAHQEIIVDALKETGLPGVNVPAVVHMAQEEVAKGVKLSKAVLVGRIERLRQAVKDQRPVLKMKRLHLSIGPQIYGDELLADKEFLKMLDKRGINWRPFMAAYKE